MSVAGDEEDEIAAEQAGEKAGRSGVSRRNFLIGGTVAGGLVVAWAIWPRTYTSNLSATDNERVFGAYLKISQGGKVTVVVPQCEMGQGVYTLLPQILADELGADWRTVAVEPAPIGLNGAQDQAAFAPVFESFGQHFGAAIGADHVEAGFDKAN